MTFFGLKIWFFSGFWAFLASFKIKFSSLHNLYYWCYTIIFWYSSNSVVTYICLFYLVKKGMSSEFHITQEQDGCGCCQKPLLKVFDLKSNIVLYTIHHDSCITNACCCGDVVFDVRDANGTTVGALTKHWAGGSTQTCGWGIECTNANTFVIDFPKAATNREKTALVGAQLLIVRIVK